MGLPLIKVQLEQSHESINFKAKTEGLMDYIWSVNNNYYTEYNPKNYGIRKYSKSIYQGSFLGDINCNYNLSKLNLDCGEYIYDVDGSIQNIFTLLALLSKENKKDFDSKWFEINHDGHSYKARFLFVKEDYIFINNFNILCNQFKLEIKKNNIDDIKLSPPDYFMDHIVSDDAIRQLWVEKKSDTKIIKASVNLYRANLVAEIIDY